MIIDSVATFARSRPMAGAVTDLETARQWTYAALDAEVDRLAAWLGATLGPASGERVAVLARNCADTLIVHLACVRAGAIFVPFNWRLSPGELSALVDDARPALIFLGAGMEAPGAAATRLDLTRATSLGEPGARPPAGARRSFDAPSTLLYTSGTSGHPKGVIVTEENAFWGSTNFLHGNHVTAASIFLCDMPLFHTAGLFAAARTPLLAGARVLISGGFDPATTLARLADPNLGITHYFSVPQMGATLWNQPGFSPDMLRGLAVYAMGGGPNPPAQVARFTQAGIRISDGFGMSETGSNFGMPVSDPDLVLDKAGSAGLPYLSVSARIIDEQGLDVAVGEPGELWLKGPSVTPGYWNRDEVTAAAFHDGWFRTGDVARIDADGFLFLLDRKKDMYISGGENVYPAEVEAVLAELDGIAEAAVIGVANERWGEVGRAYVRLLDDCELGEAAIVAHCRSRLARYKVPASIIFVEVLPRTASGKVRKNLLAATAAAD